ncbi:hypothetical protein PHLGIDRAFT_25280 [Phlebiopsis gigantea 11061_1 CR5-6]|uniref:Thiamine pyrophosphokinase n=1 Tax=Phlebiopsis gigantea (strain 11061_1 CR5-6) TaxID=745531 RepID=A0A0C3RV20_PHLG1|nr:hypothetical protein PHLGIDRAFT_25280 [Phlebiopsis gigantea 11061_1 CR5-6]
MSFSWSLPFLEPHTAGEEKYALIILNQPFPLSLLQKLWSTTHWHCCADGGANRLHDVLYDVTSASPSASEADSRPKYLPNLILGDLDSLRDDVKSYYASQDVTIAQDHDQYSTDLMKCVQALIEKEQAEGCQYDIILLGGLSGRLDQTIHTLSYLYKLRKTRKRVFTVTEENVAWILDSGEHKIHVNQAYLGITCGLLPVGIDSTVLTTTGLEWNLSDTDSCFDGMVSTSNHLVPGENVVTVKTSKPIIWTVELRVPALA